MRWLTFRLIIDSHKIMEHDRNKPEQSPNSTRVLRCFRDALITLSPPRVENEETDKKEILGL